MASFVLSSLFRPVFVQGFVFSLLFRCLAFSLFVVVVFLMFYSTFVLSFGCDVEYDWLSYLDCVDILTALASSSVLRKRSFPGALPYSYKTKGIPKNSKHV